MAIHLRYATASAFFQKCIHPTSVVIRQYSSVKPSVGRFSSLRRRFYTNLKHVFGILSREPTQNIYNEEDVASRYIQDSIDVQQWCLVYDNCTAAIFHRITALLTPFSIFSISLLGIDYWNSDGEFTYQFFKSLAYQAVQAGDLVYVPIVGSAIVLSVIFYGQSRQTFRIYMNRQNPERIRILLAHGGLFRKWVELDRKELVALPTLTWEGKSLAGYWGMWRYGQVRIRNKAYFLDDRFFRSNNFESFVIGATSRTPKDLPTMDLDNEPLKSMLKS